LLYVNDIYRILPGENNVKLFADDTNLFISGANVSYYIKSEVQLL